MSAIVQCSACQQGQHEHHVYQVVAVAPGVLGGAVCVCPGGCTDTVTSVFKELWIDPSDAS